MRTLESRTRQDRRVTCVACASHMHPETVPWLQNEIGCPVRTAALVSYREDASPRSSRALGAAASPRA